MTYRNPKYTQVQNSRRWLKREKKGCVLQRIMPYLQILIYILIYTNVRQSDLNLIPPFLAGLNNFYEKKVSKDSNRVPFSYTLQVSPLSDFLFN